MNDILSFNLLTRSLMKQILPVLTNLNVTLLCDLMDSLNVICVQSFKIPDEVAIICVVVVVFNDGYSLK